MGSEKHPHRRWLTSDGSEPVEEPEDQRPSRSQRTREVKAVNQLGLKLVALSQLKLDRIELPDDLRDAIEKCRALTKGARVRQKRLVCKMLRSEDHEAIREQVESL
jgi:ribosome-associated protein